MTTWDAEPWWKANYRNLDYVRSYADRTSQVTVREVDFLLCATSISPGASVIDVCCAHGRHVIELARRGFHVTGVDLSRTLLDHASELAFRDLDDAAPRVRWLNADSRSFVERSGQADLVVNLFTSFGFFDDDSDNARMMAECAAAVRPGGHFVFDSFTRSGTLRGLERQTWRLDARECILREHDYSPETSRLRRTTTVLDRALGTTSARVSDMRLYDHDELVDLITGSGLHIDQTFANFRGEPVAEKPKRVVIVATKPQDGI